MFSTARCNVAHLVGGDDRPERGERVPVPLRDDDRDLLVLGRVAEPGLQREAVELRLGKRERAFLLDRVLGREHEERLRERPR